MSDEWLKLGVETVVYPASEYKEGKWLHNFWLEALKLTGDEWIVSTPAPPFALGGVDAIFLDKQKAESYAALQSQLTQLQQENERLKKGHWYVKHDEVKRELDNSRQHWYKRVQDLEKELFETQARLDKCAEELVNGKSKEEIEREYKAAYGYESVNKYNHELLKENGRLKKAIEDAPHESKCRVLNPIWSDEVDNSCNCWKAQALKGGA